MTYLITALDAEAKPLIHSYKLKRDLSLPYTLYKNDDTLLLITGIGKVNAMLAVSALLGWRIPSAQDSLINIGICGAPQDYPLGETILIHQIVTHERAFYPDILYPHEYRESTLFCSDTPQSTPTLFPVDMESAGIFQAASKFFKLHQMAFLKIVSDHFEPESVTKEDVFSLVYAKLSLIETLREKLQTLCCASPSLFTPQEQIEIDTLKEYFTQSQGSALEDALCYFRLKNPSELLPLQIEAPTSKRERSEIHANLIKTLIA